MSGAVLECNISKPHTFVRCAISTAQSVFELIITIVKLASSGDVSGLSDAMAGITVAEPWITYGVAYLGYKMQKKNDNVVSQAWLPRTMKKYDDRIRNFVERILRPSADKIRRASASIDDVRPELAEDAALDA